ncbi:MAG: sugar phosphate isomerase/epimerase family protein [Planctomycetota bacterium]|jgi:hexulose-6-phosphate isomerase
MIKAISYWAMKDGLAGTHPIDNALTCAKEAGFTGMELCMGTEGVLNTQTSQAECQAIRATIESSGIAVETLASGMCWAFNPTSNEDAVRRKAIQLHADSLQRAAWLGCQAMLYVPGIVKSPLTPDELIRYDKAVERAREGVKQLLDVAEKVGVDLCVENVWNGLFYSPLEFIEFVDSFNSDRLGIYFDVGNGMGYHQHPPHWIELFGQRIKRIHIKDYKEQFGFEGSYAFCSLGEGQVPWSQTMAALKAIGYDRTIVAEMMPWDEQLLNRTSAAMDIIMAMG